MAKATRQVLHVGCGAYAVEKLHPAFREGGWDELRLDIDPAVLPDVVASITNMQSIRDASVDAVFSSHNLEHLYPHEVALALREFRRVLKPNGLAVVTMPDLQEIAALVASGKLTDAAYHSALGPICPVDVIYGFRPALAIGNLFMAHHTGFTSGSLLDSFSEAGFAASTVQRVPSSYALWGIAFPQRPNEEDLVLAQNRFLPLHSALLAPIDV